MGEAARRCDAYVSTRAGAQHMAVNAAKLVAMRRDEALRRLVDGCELVTADGQAVVWASRLLGDPLPTRVAGIDLMLELLALAERRGYRVYFLGARADVARACDRAPARATPAARGRRLSRRLLLRGRGAVGGGRDPRRAPRSAVRRDVHARARSTSWALGRRARRPVLDGRGRRRRRRRGGDQAGAAAAAALGARVGFPACSGAAAAVPALSGHELRLRSPHPARRDRGQSTPSSSCALSRTTSASASCAAVNGPVATAMQRSPSARAQAMSRGVSPMITVCSRG